VDEYPGEWFAATAYAAVCALIAFTAIVVVWFLWAI
jgi:hypothetical protein